MSTADRRTAAVARAWGWVAHLRDGGTEPWNTWEGPDAPTSGVGGLRVLPGAQQLEVLRRLNQLGPTDGVLADRVLGQSAPGRGRPDLELAGADRGSRFGPRPVEPSELPADELLRVVAGLLAEEVAAVGPTPAAPPARRRPWRRDYRLLGDPELTTPVVRELAARGRPPRRGSGVVVVQLDDLATSLADVWRHRCFTHRVRGWEQWLRGLERRDRLPVQVDPGRIADRLQAAGHRGELHLVLDPAALPGLVGTRRPVPGPDRPAGHVAELGRWVAAYVALVVPPGEARPLLRDTFRPWVADDRGPGLAVPRRSRAWVRRQAEVVAEEVERAGYAVHGDLAGLLPVEDAGALPAPVRREAALDLGLQTLRRAVGGVTGDDAGDDDDGRELDRNQTEVVP